MTAKKNTRTSLSQDEEAQIEQMLARRQAIADELHSYTSRAQAEQSLTEVFSAHEDVQFGLLKRLARTQDVAAADLLLAIHELAPDKLVRKEARRALIALTGSKIYPSWTPDLPETTVVAPPDESTPRFWRGLVTEMRESGELQLILCWEQGPEYGNARMLAFYLDFWRTGVQNLHTESGTKKHIEEQITRIQQSMMEAEREVSSIQQVTGYVNCTLAEGRRLLNEALEVNSWRKNKPGQSFEQSLSLVQELILDAPETDEDRGLTFISLNQEADMVAANFAGAWSMGDYGLCYDLLAHDSVVREGHTRDEWIELRRNWADEAQPGLFEIYFLNEREQSTQQSLWLPNSVLSTRANTPKEIELGWSLELTSTPLSGTLTEMPMGTAVYKETGRHWFWTIYTPIQENGSWRISRLKDEGAAVSAQTVEELRKHIQENGEAIQKITSEPPSNTEALEKTYEEVLLRTYQILSYEDALLTKNPSDKDLYEEAYARAISIRAAERSAVYAEELVKRFPTSPDRLTAIQRLGSIQVALAERFNSLERSEEAQHFFEIGEATLRSSLSDEEPMGYLLLAEFLMRREKYDEAEQQLLLARATAQEAKVQAQIESDLANLAIRRERFPEAQGYLERMAEISPGNPEVWAMLGFVHGLQNNFPEAEVYYKRSIEEGPQDSRPYSELGSLYIQQHQLDQARDVLSQGIRALPRSAQLRAMMAVMYLERDDLVRATEYLEEAERINPELELVQAIREEINRKKNA